jgi:thiol-disulfide isomerase/thioredoxin
MVVTVPDLVSETMRCETEPAPTPTTQCFFMNLRYIIAASAAVMVISLGVYLTASTALAPKSSFVMLDGSKRDEASFKGKVTLVNFWATSCASCVSEMPRLVSTYEKYKPGGFDTIAVAMSYDPPSYVVNFAQTRQLPFGVAIDNTGAIAKAWGEVKLTPTTYLVNKRGEVVKRYTGEPDFVELHQLIEKLLADA